MCVHNGAYAHEFACAYAQVLNFMHAHLRLSAIVRVHESVAECLRKRLQVCMHAKVRAYECEYKRCEYVWERLNARARMCV